MPCLSPFAALRFTKLAGKLEDVLAPPYDVIDEDLAEELRCLSPHNAVRLVLPKGHDDSRYRSAAGTLRVWAEAGVLATDDVPGVYVYRQEYEQAGSLVARLALFAALDLVPLDSGEVLPHEHTHAGPKKDRLALTLATRTQLSPVFMAGKDPDGELLTALRVATEGGDPDVTGQTEDGIRHALWQVTGESAGKLCALIGRYPLLIADGHHRYETALEVSRQLGTETAQQMLICVVSELDPGLVIEPTHRTLTSLPSSLNGTLAERLAEWFDIEPLDQPSPAEAAAGVASSPAGLVVVVNGETLMLTPKNLEDQRRGDPAAAIAAVQFDRRIVMDLLGTDADSAAHDGILEYHRDPDLAVRRADKQGAAFILPPVSLDAVWEATAAGFRLPSKSTCFEPKMPSGLLFRPL
jgi:uncharacterized protein (DUF1015 family)